MFRNRIELNCTAILNIRLDKKKLYFIYRTIASGLQISEKHPLKGDYKFNAFMYQKSSYQIS